MNEEICLRYRYIYTVVTRFFLSKFCPHVKGRYLWNEVDKRKNNFFSELANFSASDQLGSNFSPVQNCLKKWKNLYLIKLVSYEKVQLGKGIRAFRVLTSRM